MNDVWNVFKLYQKLRCACGPPFGRSRSLNQIIIIVLDNDMLPANQYQGVM